MIVLLLTKQIAELFLIIFLGFLIIKLKILKPEDSRILSVLVLYLIMPCVIIEAFQVKATDEIRSGLLLAYVAAILVHIIILAVSKLLEKVLKLDPVEKASAIYSNSGNLIIPIVTSVLGKEWVIYSSAFISVQIILLWTHGKMMLSGEKKADWKKIITNINMVCIFIGVLMFITGITLPAILNDTMSVVSGMIGPICMIVIGMLIGSMNLRQLLSFKRLPLVVFLRLVFFPLIMLAVLKFLGLHTTVSNGTTILLISLLATITPSASTVTQLAQIYDKDAEYASVINVVTTLLCIITMPLIVFLYQL